MSVSMGLFWIFSWSFLLVVQSIVPNMRSDVVEFWSKVNIAESSDSWHEVLLPLQPVSAAAKSINDVIFKCFIGLYM